MNPNLTNQISFSLSPDGKRLAFAGTRTATHKKQIVLLNLEPTAEAPSPLVLDADARMSDHPEFIPDGRAVVNQMASKIFGFNLATENPAAK